MNNWLSNYPPLGPSAIFFQTTLSSIVYILLYGNRILIVPSILLKITYRSNGPHDRVVFPMGHDTVPPFAPYLMTSTTCSCSPTLSRSPQSALLPPAILMNSCISIPSLMPNKPNTNLLAALNHLSLHSLLVPMIHPSTVHLSLIPSPYLQIRDVPP